MRSRMFLLGGVETDVDELCDTALLSRREAAAALTAKGYRTATTTLTTKASRGDGPVYVRNGSRALYQWRDLLNWAESRNSKRVCSASELNAAAA